MNSVFPFIAARDVKRLDDLVKKRKQDIQIEEERAIR